MFAQRLAARGTKSFVRISVLHEIPRPLFVLSFSRIDPIYNVAPPPSLKRSRIDLPPTAFQYTSILWSLDNEMLSRIRNKQVTLLELEKLGIWIAWKGCSVDIYLVRYYKYIDLFPSSLSILKELWVQSMQDPKYKKKCKLALPLPIDFWGIPWQIFVRYLRTEKRPVAQALIITCSEDSLIQHQVTSGWSAQRGPQLLPIFVVVICVFDFQTSVKFSILRRE